MEDVAPPAGLAPMEEALAGAAKRLGHPAEKLVTHTFPLSRYRDALSAAANRAQSGAIKVVLEPGG